LAGGIVLAMTSLAGQGATHIRTFHPRRGRIGSRQTDALARLWPAYGVSIPRPAERIEPIDQLAMFGRHAPLVLEIGFGMGDATAATAAAAPGHDFLAVEVHTPGIANLLTLLEERGLSNVRVAHGDALDLVGHMLPPDSLHAVHVFFPDPWPKSRHHKRRIIRPEHVALIRSRLEPGGLLHCATDWAEYAEAMHATLAADPGLVNAHGGYAPRPAHRPRTRFEQRALDAGRPIFDLVFHREGRHITDR
jgi:tRNA (guanine-N7-)-methyltransferase